MIDELDTRYLDGVRLFNAREYYACHDVWEDLWGDTLGPDREFYQGLIHTAVALHHFEEGNLGGARKMFTSAHRYLEPFGDSHLGLDLRSLRAEFRSCFAQLLVPTNEYPAGVVLDPDRAPRLRMTRDVLP